MFEEFRNSSLSEDALRNLQNHFLENIKINHNNICETKAKQCALLADLNLQLAYNNLPTIAKPD